MNPTIIKLISEKNALIIKAEKKSEEKDEYARKNKIIKRQERLLDENILEKYYTLNVEENEFLEKALELTNLINRILNFNKYLIDIYHKLVYSIDNEDYVLSSELTEKINCMENKSVLNV